MQRDARLLRIYQACLVLGGSFAAFIVLDVVLALTGIYPWTDMGSALLRLGLAALCAALAFVLAVRAWRQREHRNLAGATFADAVIVLGFMLVGGFLLLGLLR